jgi:molybdopterin converting factor small subunit
MNFRLSGNLLRFSEFKNEVQIDAPNVTQAILGLVEKYPLLGPVLLDGDKRMRRLHRVFLNGEQLDSGELDRPVGSTDEVTILTAIAGG